MPADIILLDTGLVKDRESICFIDTSLIDGNIQVQKKKASYLTQSREECLTILQYIF